MKLFRQEPLTRDIRDFLTLLEKKGQLKIKNPTQLQELLDIARKLLDDIDAGVHVQENPSKLVQMKTVLEM